MNKNTFFFATALTLILSFLNPIPAQASEKTVETYDKGFMDVWAVAPTFYEGSKDIIIYSSNNPNGTHVALEEVYLGDNGWSLFLGTHERGIETSEGNYWAIASTSGNDVNLETAAKCYIDTDPKSIFPDLDDDYSSYTLIKEPEKEVIGYLKDGVPVFDTSVPVPDGCVPIHKGTEDDIYVESSGAPQLFCLFGDIETLPQSAEEAEMFFVPLMQKYVEKQYGFVADDMYLETFYGHISASALQATGHFDDYFYFYRPLGIPLYRYMIETENNALQSLAVGKVETSIDWTIREFVAYAEGLPSALDEDRATFEQLEEWYIKQSWSYKTKDWGWDFYVDTRDLERDNDGYVCEDVRVTEESNGKLLFPALGDEIPKDLPGFAGVLDTHPGEIKVPESDSFSETEPPNGESSFEVFPEEEEEPKKENPPKVQEVEQNSFLIPIIILAVIVGAIFLIIIIKKKKR